MATRIDRRRSRAALGSVASAVLVAVLVACAEDATTGTNPSATPAEALETTGSTPDNRPGVEGRWTTAPIPVEDFSSTLKSAGLAEHAAVFTADLTGPVTLSLVVEDGFWTQYRAIGGGVDEVNDRATYEVEGDTVVVTPRSGGVNTYRWSVTGDELDLELVSTTEPPYNGTPGEVYLRGYYTTASFSRATS